MKYAIAAEAAKAAPPVAVAGSVLIFGLTVNDAVQYATLAYLALQAMYLLWKWRREARRK